MTTTPTRIAVRALNRVTISGIPFRAAPTFPRTTSELGHEHPLLVPARESRIVRLGAGGIQAISWGTDGAAGSLARATTRSTAR